MSKNLCNSSTHWLIKLTLCIIINVLTFLFEIIWLATTVFPKAVVAFKIPLSYFNNSFSGFPRSLLSTTSYKIFACEHFSTIFSINPLGILI